MIEHEVEPYSVLEVKQLIEAAKRERNGVRWVVALVLGLRQGEALGLKWDDGATEREAQSHSAPL